MDTNCIFTDSNVLNTYLYGGKAVVTLEAPSGTNHTYEYSKPRNSEQFPEDVRFVYCIHDNSTKFYIGMVENDNFRLTRNSRFLDDTDIVKGAKYIEKLRKNPALLKKTPMKIYHNGRCAKCGRMLNTDKALKIGFGKKCYNKLKSSPLFTDYIMVGTPFSGKFVV